MKHLSISLLILIIFPLQANFSQQFHINNNPADAFALDRIGHDVYYRDMWSQYYIKKNLFTQQTDTTEFFYIAPTFANKSHKSAYFENNSIVRLRDYDNDTSYYIFSIGKELKSNNSPGGFESANLMFSPNDSLILYPSWTQPNTYKAFRLSDSTFYQCPVQTADYSRIEWGSDSTLIMATGNQNVVTECYLYSGKIDTLALAAEWNGMMGYSYNIRHNILAYSYFKIPMKIFLYYKDGDSTRVIFDLGIDPDPVCSESGFTYLKWDAKGDNLAILSDLIINSGSGVMNYNLSEDKTSIYLRCDDYGKKYYIDWWDLDTVIYFDATHGNIDGFVLKTPIGIKEESEIKTDDIKTIAYPNPFNSTTTIDLNDEIDQIDVKIYNTLGELITSYQLNNQNKISWNGVDKHGREVNTGIYFITYRTQNKGKKNLSINKIIYLK